MSSNTNNRTPRNKAEKAVAEFAQALRNQFLNHEEELMSLTFMPRDELNTFNLMTQIIRDLCQYAPEASDVERYVRRQDAFIRLRWDDYLECPQANRDSPGGA